MEKKLYSLKTDEDLRDLLPPLEVEVYKSLEKNIVERGFMDIFPIVTWNGVIVDGYIRYEICHKHKIAFTYICKDFEFKSEAMLWKIEMQLGQRNIEKEQADIIFNTKGKNDVVNEKTNHTKRKMQELKVKELIPHPRNEEFFDNITGEAWTEFLKSIETSGVIEPIIISQDKIIVSGNQRGRGCIALGIETVPCEVRIYEDEDMMLKDLIETNIRQRGIGNPNPVKFGRCLKELERIYGIQNGGDRKSVPNNSDVINQTDLADIMGISVDTLNNYKKLTTLIPEVQELIDTGIVTPTTALAIARSMSDGEQEEMISTLDISKRITKKEVDKYIQENKELQEKVKSIDKLKDELSKGDEEQKRLKNKISNLLSQEKQPKIITEQVDKPETLEEIDNLKKQLDEKQKRNLELNNIIMEKSKLLSKAMGESTNVELMSSCSELTLKMMDFLESMAKYNYLAESFNEIPISTRMEYHKYIMAINKWSNRILEVIDTEKNIIDM